MDLEPFEILEEQVYLAIREIQKLRDENRILKSETENLTQQLNQKQVYCEKIQKELDDLKTIKKNHHKMEKDKELVKTKIQGILKDLEKINI